VEVVRLEELEAVLETSQQRHVVTSRYFCRPRRAGPSALWGGGRWPSTSMIPHELDLLQGTCAPALVGLVEHHPASLRAAEVILHSMRGNDLLG